MPLSKIMNKIMKNLFNQMKMLQINFIIVYIIYKISILFQITRILKTLEGV